MVEDIYFVDCENVGLRHLCDIDDVETCRIYYFCGICFTDNFKMGSHEHLVRVDHTGCKDALDFIIDSYIGYQIRNFGKRVTYHIISRDTGFSNLAKFWGSEGFNVKVVNNFITSNNKIYLDLDSPIVSTESAKAIIHRQCQGISTKVMRKIYNAYASWWHSRERDHDLLVSQICRISSEGYMSEMEKSRLANYLYDVTFKYDLELE
jgi:hypothetical protein